MLLQEAAPDRVAAYQRLFLEAAGVRAPMQLLDSAFGAAFPLPADLERGLAEFVCQHSPAFDDQTLGRGDGERLAVSPGCPRVALAGAGRRMLDYGRGYPT